MTSMSTEAATFSCLMDNFVRSVPGLRAVQPRWPSRADCVVQNTRHPAAAAPGRRHTLVVSADGLLMAMSDGLDRTGADQLSAIVAGLSSLTRGAARQLGSGGVRQSVVEMDSQFLFLMSISDGSMLAVVADAGCDVGVIGYEMALLVGRTESALTPQLVSEMRSRLSVDGPTRASLSVMG